jgi:hypothetical protein
VFGITMSESESSVDMDCELKPDNCFPLLGILALRTYAFYHGNKKILAFLVSLHVVRLPLLLHWISIANRVILGRYCYRYRDCARLRTHSAMYVIHLSGLLSNASSSI